jgi:DNA-binding transcriptional LysR family regulator
MPDSPDLRYLRAFVVTAEELHFTRAAARLHVTQQALSLQIRQLEASVGAPLFTRTTRKVELTSAGRTMLAHAVSLLASADRAWQEVARVAAGEAGQVLLSYSPTVRREILPTVLEELARRHPNITIRSVEAWGGGSGVEDGHIDVSITRSRPGDDAQETVSVPILQSPLGLIVAAGHPIAACERASALAELRDEVVKIPPRPFAPHFHDTIVEALRRAGFGGEIEELTILGSGILRDDTDAQAEIAEGRAVGVGFAHQYTTLEPDFVWREIEPTQPIPMHLCWRRDASPAVRNLVAVTLEVAEAQGWLPSAEREEAERLLAA